MEDSAAMSPEMLLRGLDFRSGQSASYVLERRLGVQFPAQTGSPYSPNDTKLMRIHLADPDPCLWLDLSTLRLNFKVQNTNPNNVAMSLVGPPHVLFQRVRVLCKGTLVEDRLTFGRECSQMMFLRIPQRNEDDLKEVPWHLPIAQNQTATFSYEPMLGLLQIPQMWLLHMAPLTFEFEMAYTFDQACAGINNVWRVTEPYISADTLHLDPGFCQQYANSIMRGIPLSLEFSSQATQSFVVPQVNGTNAAEFSIAIARAFAGIRGLIITFYGQPPAPAGTAPQTLKDTNYFYYPSTVDGFEAQVLFGGKVMPVHPMRGAAAAFVNTRKALSQMKQGYMDITYDQWQDNRFILMLNFERGRMGNGIEASHTGLGSQGGENVVINFRGTTGTRGVSHCFVTLIHECVLSIRADGVEMKL